MIREVKNGYKVELHKMVEGVKKNNVSFSI